MDDIETSAEVIEPKDSKETILQSILKCKNKFEELSSIIDTKDSELKQLKEERLRIQGAYQGLLEVALSLDYVVRQTE